MRFGRGRWIAAALGALLVAAAAGAGFALREGPQAPADRAPGERPQLLLLTSLPILFPDEFTLDGDASPALAALEKRYRVVPISTADTQSLRGHRLLLMAQPQAQPAEMLVELDDWVRRGGRVLVLADPVLEWPSDRPLGDVLRPSAAFADTGLLGHWGVRLEAPEERGPKSLQVGGREIRAASPGRLVATGPNCAVPRHGFVARCRVGSGEAVIVADADFLNVGQANPEQRENLDFVLDELARLEQ